LALLLNIDTATEVASVCLSENESSILQKENVVQKEHASFVHEAIKQIMNAAGRSLTQVDAIAITSGPGSYTGLRVGMATAKGLCYALRKPLITINTLEVMAAAAINQNPNLSNNSLLCPMIDARRLEVFTALYNISLNNILLPCAMILERYSLEDWLKQNQVVFFGSGSKKFEEIQENGNAIFKSVQHTSNDLALLAEKYFNKKEFANLAYAEPLYIKEFYTK
jgi:tRNA threonylcarbamoyladenosine biosynthesis protein TsaB